MMSKLMKRKGVVKYILMALILPLSMAGCMKKELYNGLGNPDDEGGNKTDGGKVTLDNYFDFSTRREIQLTVDYGPECPKAYFEVYAENPLVYREEGGQVTKREDIIHIAGGFADGAGRYSKTVTVPASVSEVYIYSPDFGVPRLYKTEVANNAVNAVITFDNELDVSTPARARMAEGRAASDRIQKKIPYVLGNWNAEGMPDYLNPDLKIKVTPELKQYITKHFPEGKNNGNSPYISHNGDILIKEAANVWLNYFGGDTSAQSVFAYYCYKEGASQQQIKEAATKRACVVFPCANKNPLGNYSGVGAYLKYIDEEGNLLDAFPAGTKIGVLLWNNGFINNGDGTFYSTESLNSDKRSHTAVFAATASSGLKYNIITMEDWKDDTDYNDVAFVISSNPVRAIEIPDAPKPDEDRTGTNTYCGLLGFEDNWPAQGDYDMNDVVITYNSQVTYNQSNNILGITDEFTLEWTGAKFSNGFSYEVPFDFSLVDVDLSKAGEAASRSGNNVINLFNDARKELGVSGMSAGDMPAHADEIHGKTYRVSVEFKKPYPYGVTPPYNPFIRMGAAEVHLPNRAPTSAANNVFPSDADISDGKTTFFICEDGYPFAIHLDARKDNSMMDINLKREGVRIDETYPGFKSWAATRDPQTIWWK